MSAEMDRKVQRPSWRSKPATIGLICVGLLVAAGVLAIAARSLTDHAVRVPLATVTIDTVQRGVYHDVIPLRGTVTPHDTIDLDALEGGQVDRIMVQNGDHVAAGQPLVAFRNTELELDVLDREGRLIESITQLQTYEKELEDARLSNQKTAAQIEYNITRLTRAADRRDPVAADGVVSAESIDQIHDELSYDLRIHPLQIDSDRRQEALRIRQLPQIHADLINLAQSLKVTRSKLDNLIVKAPVTGQLTDFNLNIGQNLNRGDRLGEVVPNTGFKIAADVDEFYLSRVVAGQTAVAQIDDQDRKLVSTRVYPQVKNGTFVVDLAFVGATPVGLQPGQTVTGTLSLGGDQPALVLPAGPFLDRSGGDWVMVLTSDHQAERRRVKLGRRSTEQVEILSGLSPGDRVITSDYSAFEKIDRVNLTQ